MCEFQTGPSSIFFAIEVHAENPVNNAERKEQ